MGFPHSDTCGSTLICSSPQLFAAYRVLLRLPMPRHSPCALFSLNFMSSANLFRLKCSCDSLVTVLIFRSSTRYVVVVTLCVSTSVILLDLLFLHLCFIQFSRYISFRLSPFVVFDIYCRGPRPLVGSSGLEPPTLRLSGARSSLLSYEPMVLFSPFPTLVEMKRFELLTPCLQGRCSPN